VPTPLRVELSNRGNPDRAEDPLRPLPGVPCPGWVEVDSMAEASRRCRDYIEEHALGAGHWTGGRIRNEAGKMLAYVSYNGKVWAGEPGSWQPGDAPLYDPAIKPGPKP
jgi:hypothetical protein